MIDESEIIGWNVNLSINLQLKDNVIFSRSLIELVSLCLSFGENDVQKQDQILYMIPELLWLKGAGGVRGRFSLFDCF